MAEKKVKIKDKEKYWQGIGRRKTSIASVRISKTSKKEAKVVVNSKKFKAFFPNQEFRKIILSPLKVLEEKGLSVSIVVKGGGFRGQAEAVRLGLARAIVKFKSDLKKELKDLGYLTRDPRKKERKKPGLKKARRAPQFSKR